MHIVDIKFLVMLAGSFMDKMYSMSSPESLVKFVRSPRTYLVPPHPMLPCKVCVLGPPLAGKTILANMIAEKYDAIVSTTGEIHNIYCTVNT